jgi:sortase A
MSEIDTPSEASSPAADGDTFAASAQSGAPSLAGANGASLRANGSAATPGSDGVVRFGQTSANATKLTWRGRVRKFDRPPPPHDWRWYVGNLGKTLIAVGLLMFSFVGYQLYGTGIETAAAQSRLEDEFEEQLDAVAPISAPDFESNGSSTETPVDDATDQTVDRPAE